jgi:hypothetical protein
MKNVSLFSGLLLLCSAPAFAQSPDTTSRPAQTPDSNSRSNETSRAGNATSSKTTMTGCISERNGKYILMTNSMANNQSTGQSSAAQSGEQPPTSQSSQSGTQSGQTSAQTHDQTSAPSSKTSQGIELTGTQDLKQHVGHTVRVTGTMTNSATGSSSTTTTPDRNSDSNQNNGTTSNGNKMDRATMKVTDIQMVSETCEMKGAAPTPPQR